MAWSNVKMISIGTMSDSDLCYKSCGDYIVTMKKLPDTVTNESRKGVSDPLHAKFRADKLLVVRIEHKTTGKRIDKIQNTSYKYNQIWYEVLKEVSVPDYDPDHNQVCASGIHYFLSRDAAFYWNIDQTNDNDGIYRSWFDNGQYGVECTYIGGKLHGSYQSWYYHGQKDVECNYVSGERHGSYQTWYDNGRKKQRCSYINGSLHGRYQDWYSNGRKKLKCTYINGSLHRLYQIWYVTGQKEMECMYVTGKLHGLYQVWYRNSRVWKEFTFDSGVLHGYCISWHNNGQIKKECSYVTGKLHGIYRYWSKKRKMRVC